MPFAPRPNCSAEEALMGLDQSRTIVNYGYWKTRCRVEQSKNALAARKLFYQATQAQEVDVDLEGAKKSFEEGFQKWRLVLDEFPSLIEDGITGEDLVLIVPNLSPVPQTARRTISQAVYPRRSAENPRPDAIRDPRQKYRGREVRERETRRTLAATAPAKAESPPGS